MSSLLHCVSLRLGRRKDEIPDLGFPFARHQDGEQQQLINPGTYLVHFLSHSRFNRGEGNWVICFKTLVQSVMLWLNIRSKFLAGSLPELSSCLIFLQPLRGTNNLN